MSQPATKQDTARKSSVAEKYSSRRRNRNAVEENVRPQVDLTENLIYDVLADSTIPFEDRMEKIVSMLTVDLASEEGVETSQKNVQMVKDIVKELLNRFTAHNRASIEFTRDNPLSALKESMKEVFDNYHTISVGRSDLKGKLMNVDKLIEQVGGEDKLVVALVEAKTKEQDRLAKIAAVNEAEAALSKATTEMTSISLQIQAAERTEKEAKAKSFASFRPGVQAEIRAAQTLQTQLTTDLAVATTARDEAKTTSSAAIKELHTLTNSDEYAVHIQITKILDIADPAFKQQLTDLANATLNYIDDTQRIMSQVRDQLEILMKDVDGGLDVNVNIREQVAVLRGALQQANEKSAEKLSEYKKANKDSSALAQLESSKIARAGDIFLSETASTTASVTMISSEVQKIEIVLLALRDQLADGLSDADEQLLMAVNTASASGMVMLNRAQTLGTLAQAIISRGQYMQESEETFGQLAQEFERSLAVKAGRNDTIASLSSVIADISVAMEDRNDAATGIAIERRELIGDLSEQIDRLRQVAEETRELESRVNEELERETD